MKKKLFSLLTLALFAVCSAWGTTGTDVIDQTDASSGTAMTKTAVTLPGNYIAGQGGGNIKDYSPSNKGIKLRTQNTTVKVGDVTYGYAVLTVNSGYKLTSFKMEGTSNGSSNSIDLLGVYTDINTESLATSLAGATNKLASTVTFPKNSVTYVSTGKITITATSNIVLTFPSSGDNQLRSIITVDWETLPLGPTITSQPVGASYATGDPISALTVSATASTGDLSYQWKTCDDALKTNAANIAGQTSASYTPSAAGFYFVTVTDGAGSIDSDVVEITISDPTAASIVTHPETGSATVGVEKTLTVEASGVPSTFTYQWYECEDELKTNPSAVGTNSDSYSFTPSAAGTRYFYVTVSNGVGVAAVSNVATITISLPQTATPVIKVYGSKVVEITCATASPTISYKVNDGDWTTYTDKFIPAASGTIYAKATATGYSESATASQAVTLPNVGATTGSLLMAIQPGNCNSDAEYDKDGDDWVFTKAGYTLKTTAKLLNTPADTGYPNMFKPSKGTFTITPPADVTIQSIKVYGESNATNKTNNIQKVTDISSVVSDYATLIEKNITVSGVGILSEVVLSADDPGAGNDIKFTLGGDNNQARLYIEVYGTTTALNEAITPAKTYTTYIPTHNLDFTSHAKLTAYIATAASGSSVTLTSINKVPAGTPIILKATETGAAIDVPVAATTDDASLNKLSIGDGKTQIGGDGKFDYILKNGLFCKVTTASALAAGKCYLHLTAAPEANELTIDFEDGETTGVVSVGKPQTTTNREFYNLAGQRVAQPTKGLYIVNGKKVVIK